MESLETKLFEAALSGRVDSLQTLLTEDPLILDRVSTNYNFSDTPLHVASIVGHTDFVKEIIRLKPQLTNDLNSHQSSPLHLASAKGHVDIVRALLAVDPQLCMARDKNGLVPIHLAAVKGRIEVLKLLLDAKPDAARLVGYRGENILHMCVKCYQLEALKLVVNTVCGTELLNAKDSDGNTVLDLAVADKQVEAVNFLLTLPGLELNTTNNNGMTILDVLIQSRRDVRDSKIEKSIRNAGGFGASETNIPLDMGPNRSTTMNERLRNDEWLDKMKSSLMVVASLIATMAFQVGVNPPGGLWQQDSIVDSLSNNINGSNYTAIAGQAILARNSANGYLRFYIVNTVGLVASLSIILLLVSGLPLRRKFFMWILMVITWIAISAVALVYDGAIVTVTPHSYDMENSMLYVIGLSVFVWIGLMGLLLVCHTIRLMVKIIKKLMKALRPRRRRYQGGV